MDLGPTFCEAGGIDVPATMTGRSLMPVLKDPRSGQIDPARDFVVTGRERHVGGAREGYLPYPQRSLRTRDFIYIVNFEPDRWPMGDPKGLDDPNTTAPDFETLAYDTFVAYADLDASPTKAWMIHHREDHDVEPLYELAFGKRPREELYDLNEDPHYMNNVADAPAYANVRSQLEGRLIDVLRAQHDPRLMEQPCRYEFEPYAACPHRHATASRSPRDFAARNLPVRWRRCRMTGRGQRSAQVGQFGSRDNLSLRNSMRLASR